MTKEEFDGWKTQPETKYFLNYLKDAREYMKERWAEGDFTFESDEVSNVKNIDAICRAQIYKDIIEMDFEQIDRFYQET